MDKSVNKITKKITILGSTGSIGENTVDIVSRFPDLFQVVALTANRNVSLLAHQAKKLNAECAVVADDNKYLELKQLLSGTDIEVASGTEALLDAAERNSDLTMASIVGVAGLLPTLASIKSGKVIGLANKECLVSAGEIFIKELDKKGAKIIPVDSEHNAIFQAFNTSQKNSVRRIILTASGGPFHKFTEYQMKNVTREQAINHPNWNMGAKISIDSATMMNKGLEVIEAYYLFPIEKNAIEILIHPQSIVHSMVDYFDGSVIAQLGMPDMRTPISYALSWPNRIETPVPRLELEKIKELTFEPPDPVKFPALRASREALEAGGYAPTILNAANEVAVENFLNKKIEFGEIIKLIDKALEKIEPGLPSSIEDVLSADRSAREFVKNSISQ